MMILSPVFYETLPLSFSLVSFALFGQIVGFRSRSRVFVQTQGKVRW